MSAKTNFWVDIAIFFTFLVAFEPKLTGDDIHEWLSVALAAVLVIHVILHWDWVINVGLKFVQKLFHSSRLNFVVDLLLFLAVVLVMVSGLLISRSVVGFLGITLTIDRTWRILHSWSSDISVFLLALHFALHWKWIVSTITRYIIAPIRGMFRRPAAPSKTLAVKE